MVRLLRALALLATCVLTPSGSQAAAPSAADDAGVSVSLRLEVAKDDKGELAPVELGDAVTAVFEIHAPVEAKVFPPSPPNFGAAFRRLTSKATVTRKQEADGRVTERHAWSLLAVRVGPERVPAFEVPWSRPDGSSGAIETERVRLRVRPRLANEQDPRLGAMPAPVSVITTDWALIWSLALLGSAALAALFTIVGVFVYRNRIIALKPVAPPPPANVAALARLEEALSSQELASEERYAAVVDVLRWYLGERFGFDGLETTTVEMRRALDDADLGAVSVYEIAEMLEEADLVKFARMVPGDGQSQSKAEFVRRVVEETWREPEPREEEDEVTRLEPASVHERSIAGAIDVGFASLVGVVTATSAWRIVGVQWAWLGLVAYAVVVLARDVGRWTSPGRLSQALIVVDRGELQRPAALGQKIGRNLLLALPPGALIEALMMRYHPLHIRVGDVASNTEVVRQPTESQRHDEVAPSPPAQRVDVGGAA